IQGASPLLAKIPPRSNPQSAPIFQSLDELERSLSKTTAHPLGRSPAAFSLSCGAMRASPMVTIVTRAITAPKTGADQLDERDGIGAGVGGRTSAGAVIESLLAPVGRHSPGQARQTRPKTQVWSQCVAE